jgi:hypothetical protein
MKHINSVLRGLNHAPAICFLAVKEHILGMQQKYLQGLRFVLGNAWF